MTNSNTKQKDLVMEEPTNIQPNFYDKNKIYVSYKLLDHGNVCIVRTHHKQAYDTLLDFESYLELETRVIHSRSSTGQIIRNIVDVKNGVIVSRKITMNDFKVDLEDFLLISNDFPDFPYDEMDKNKLFINNLYRAINFILMNYRITNDNIVDESDHFLFKNGTQIREYKSKNDFEVRIVKGVVTFIRTNNLPKYNYYDTKEEIEKSYSVYTDFIDRVFGKDVKDKKGFYTMLSQMIFEDRSGKPRGGMILSGERASGKGAISIKLLGYIFPQSICRVVSESATTETYGGYNELGYAIVDEKEEAGKYNKAPFNIYDQMKLSGSGEFITIRQPGGRAYNVKNKTWWILNTNSKKPIVITDKIDDEADNQIFAYRMEKSLKADKQASQDFMAKHKYWEEEMEKHIGDFLYHFLLPFYKKYVLPQYAENYRYGILIRVTPFLKSLISSDATYETTTLNPVIIDILTNQFDFEGKTINYEKYEHHLKALKKRAYISNYLLRLIIANLEGYGKSLNGIVIYFEQLGIIINENAVKKIGGHPERGYYINENSFQRMLDSENIIRDDDVDESLNEDIGQMLGSEYTKKSRRR